VGLQRATTVVRLDPADCFSPIPSGADDDVESQFYVPAMAKLVTAAGTSAAAFIRCAPSTKSPVSFSSLAIIPIPPFLVPCAAANAHSSFAELGVAMAAEIAAAAFTTEGGKKLVATEGGARLLQFIWWAERPISVTEDYRAAITLIADPRPSVAKWRDSAIREAIGIAEPAPAPAATGIEHTVLTTELVGALGDLRKTMDSIALKETSSEAEGAKNLGKLPSHLQTLLFRLSYVPGLPEPLKLTPEGVSFMSQATLASATSLLKTALRQKFGLNVTVQAGSVQALRNGLLIWDDPSVPGNHSVFQYYAPTPGDTADSAQDLAWHLTSTEGRGVESSDIQKAMKLKPRASGSAFGCSRQVLHFGCVHGFLYGQSSPIHEALKELAEWMLSAGAMSVLERMADRVPKFYERLLATVDIRVQEYISSCAYADEAEAIESSLINFETIKTSLRLQNSSDLAGPIFPGSPAAPVSGEKRTAADDISPDNSKTRPVANISPHPSLALLTFPEWDKVRKSTDSLPKANGKTVCARFHCRQACFTGCTNVHGKLGKGAIKLMEKWIAESKAAHSKGEGGTSP
jgi:hypothetical protein